MAKPNKSRRYRLKPEIARKLGFEVKQYNKYTLSPEQEKESRFLGVGAKLKHEGFQMWVKCMKGDKQALKEMVEYCDMDIIVLEDVFLVLQNYIKHNAHAGVIGGGHKAECPNCGSERTSLLKNNFTAAGTIKRLMECDTCSYTYEISNAAYRQKLEFDANFAPQNLGENIK